MGGFIAEKSALSQVRALPEVLGKLGDYELAIEEGATVVRVGQAIFGKRPLPDSHYWPGLG